MDCVRIVSWYLNEYYIVSSLLVETLDGEIPLVGRLSGAPSVVW